MKIIKSTIRSLDMTEGNAVKSFLLFALPLVLTNLLQQFYNVCDSIIVGKFAGANALAAVGICGTINGLLVCLMNGLAGGSCVSVAQRFGARDFNGVSKAVHTSIAVSIAGGAILTVIGLTCSRVILQFMKTPQEIIDDAVLYMIFLYVGMIPSMIYGFGAGILRSVGDSSSPLIFLIVSTVVNITFNLIFVAAFHMGVFGVGLSTLISQIISAILVMFVLVRVKDIYRVNIKEIRFHKEYIIDILKIGIPAGIQGSTFAISNTLIKTYINMFGVTIVAADAVGGNIDSIGFMIIAAFSSAMTTFAGQNYGKKRYERVYKDGLKCILTGALVVAAVCIFGLLFSKQLPYIFTNDAEIAYWSTIKLRMLLVCMSIYSAADYMSACIRSCGKSMPPMVMSILSICVLRVLWCMVALNIDYSVQTVYMSYPVSYVIYFVVSAIYMFGFKRFWLK